MTTTATTNAVAAPTPAPVRASTRQWSFSIAGILALIALVAAASASGTRTEAISIKSPLEGATVSGSVPWEVLVSEDVAGKVEFAIDDVVVWTEQEPPYVFNGDTGLLDTTTLSDGWHVLSATAFRNTNGKGRKEQANVRVLVANAEVPSLETITAFTTT